MNSFSQADVSADGRTAQQIAGRLQRYDRPGPRYTSYPTAVEFTGDFDENAYRARLHAAAKTPGQPLSLYVHLPFCEARCTYCGCMTIITQKRPVAARYLEYLEREIEMLATTLRDRRGVVQHHWGGGTPTYLTPDQIERLHRTVTRHFDISPNAEQAIEIDPRVTTRDQLQLLRSLGFNRLSMGVQDFTPEVQDAIGRRQSAALTRDLYDYARSIGFDAINMDLIYGLPRQTVSTFACTLSTVAAMRPDRIAVYSYAHVPWLRPHQSRINVDDLPSRQLKFELISTALDTFGRAGYQSIGMDHFALPGDELAIAMRQRRLHRNFMGYTTMPATDMVGVGLSAIGDVRGAFAQNVKKLLPYYAALDSGRFPIDRGYSLSADDCIRQFVIKELMCNFFVDLRDVEARFEIDFERYFAPELDAMSATDGAIADQFVTMTQDSLEVLPEGRLFVRSICMYFDRYLRRHTDKPVFSRTI